MSDIHLDHKNIILQLPPKDARTVLAALFSEEDDLPEMTTLASITYTILNGDGRLAKIAGKKHNKITAAALSLPVADTDNDMQLQDRRFAEFWALYPRKVGKEAARKAWMRIKPSLSHHDLILSTVQVSKKCEQWIKDNGCFIPNPATWLNQGRWDDEVQPASTGQVKHSTGVRGNFAQREYENGFFDKFVTNDFGE